MERKPIVPRMAKIAMTTTSSTRVKPGRRLGEGTKPGRGDPTRSNSLDRFVWDAGFICGNFKNMKRLFRGVVQRGYLRVGEGAVVDADFVDGSGK